MPRRNGPIDLLEWSAVDLDAVTAPTAPGGAGHVHVPALPLPDGPRSRGGAMAEYRLRTARKHGRRPFDLSRRRSVPEHVDLAVHSVQTPGSKALLNGPSEDPERVQLRHAVSRPSGDARSAALAHLVADSASIGCISRHAGWFAPPSFAPRNEDGWPQPAVMPGRELGLLSSKLGCPPRWATALPRAGLPSRLYSAQRVRPARAQARAKVEATIAPPAGPHWALTAPGRRD